MDQNLLHSYMPVVYMCIGLHHLHNYMPVVYTRYSNIRKYTQRKFKLKFSAPLKAYDGKYTENLKK